MTNENNTEVLPRPRPPTPTPPPCNLATARWSRSPCRLSRPVLHPTAPGTPWLRTSVSRQPTSASTSTPTHTIQSKKPSRERERERQTGEVIGTGTFVNLGKLSQRPSATAAHRPVTIFLAHRPVTFSSIQTAALLFYLSAGRPDMFNDKTKVNV